MRRGRLPRLSGAVVLAVAVGLLAATLVAGLGRTAWIAGAVLVPISGLLLATGAWSASEVRGDGTVALLTRSAAPLVASIAACVALLALPGWLLDRSDDELIAWTAPDVVLVDGDVALSVAPSGDPPATTTPGDADADPRPGVVVGRDPDDGRERWRTTLRPSTAPYDVDDPDGWRRIGDVVLVSGGGFGFAALDVRTGRLLWQDPAVAPRVVLATTRTVATTSCTAPAAGADDDAAASCTAQARDLRTGRVRWSAATRDEGRLLGAPATAPASDDGPWPSRWAVVDAPAVEAPEGGRAWTIRDLDTGAVRARGRGTTETTLTTLAGGVLRGDEADPRDATAATRLRLLDPASGRTRWARTVDGRPADAGASSRFSVAAPAGLVALQERSGSLDAGLEPPGSGARAIQLLEPRTGRPVAVRLADDARRVVPVRAPFPGITAAAVAVGPAPAGRLVVVDPDADLGLVLVPGAERPPVTWPADGARPSDVVLAGPLTARRRRDHFADAVGETVEGGVELRDAGTARVVGRLRIDGAVSIGGERDRIVVRREGGRGQDDEDLVLVRRP